MLKNLNYGSLCVTCRLCLFPFVIYKLSLGYYHVCEILINDYVNNCRFE